MNKLEILEEGIVKSVTGRSLVVDVGGVEVYVFPTVEYSGCDCCGDSSSLEISYNRTTADRIEKHGVEDPLGIK